MAETNLTARLRAAAMREAVAVRRTKVLSAIGAFSVLPTAASVIVGIFFASDWLPLWIFVALLVVVGILAVWACYTNLSAPQTAAELFFAVEALEQENESCRHQVGQAEQDVRYLGIVSEYAITSQVIVREYHGRPLTVDTLRSLASRLLAAPIEHYVNSLVDLKEQEVFSCCIYLYSKTTGRLHATWTYRSPGHPAMGPPRSWRPPYGHVGLAFARQRSLITGDAAAADIAGVLDMPDALRKPYDSHAYRSFASCPIGGMASEPVFGVLVATSSMADAFDPASVLLLRNSAAALATTLAVSGLDVDPADATNLAVGGQILGGGTEFAP